MRHPDWASRLITYLGQVRGEAFSYGQFDCALFAAGAVAAMTGEDLAEGFRGQYANEREGRRLLAGQGLNSAIDLAARHFDEIDPIEAMPGDLAVVVDNGQQALGVVQGANVYLVASSGLNLLPRDRIGRAFRVI